MRSRLWTLALAGAFLSCGPGDRKDAAGQPAAPLVTANGYVIDVAGGREPAVAAELESDVTLLRDAQLAAQRKAESDVDGPPPRASRASSARAAKRAEAEKRTKWIVQLAGPVHEAEKAQLAALGARLGDYLPEFAFVVSMDGEARAKVAKLPFVRGVVRLKPAYKVARTLTDASGAVKVEPGKSARLLVRVDAPDGLAPVVSVLRDSKGKMLHVGRDVAAVDLLQAEIARLARLEEVLWIEPALPARLVNDTSRWTIQTYVQGDTSISGRGLDGLGQIVGVGDTGLDYDACWFRDPAAAPIGPSHRKVAGYLMVGGDDYDGNMGHGTHVTGTVAGDQSPITGGAGANGMAPAARVVVSDLFLGENNWFYPPSDLAAVFATPYALGARIHTNSWGSSANAYDSLAWSTDRFMWEHRDFLVLFANGNAGPGEFSVGSPATAKNVISVGATENGAAAENLASFSSNGPTGDGRTKPTLTAPGVRIVSADSDGISGSNNCGTVAYSGTSMATPTTAGAAALVRQYYEGGFWPSGLANPADAFSPSAALVKGTLVNAAQNATGENVDGPIPSTGQGWGRINLSNTLRFAADTQYLDVVDFTAGLATGASWTKQVFSTGTQPLKVTLVWTDPPGSQIAGKDLVNDLDLTVTGPRGATTYLGNVFGGGESIAGGAPDRLNVEEQVFLPAAATGPYTIRVTGYNVPTGPQPFAIVVTGAGGVTSAGQLNLNRARYNAAATIEIKVSDVDLNADPSAADEAFVSVTSDADPAGEVVRLVEAGNRTGVFLGTLATGPAPGVAGDGILAVSDGGAITATYQDADDGTGVPTTVTAAAVGDLVAPVLAALSVGGLEQDGAVISWTTSEPALASVRYGTTPALGAVQSSPLLATEQAVRLTGLAEATRYLFAAVATDEAGNVGTDDAGGALYAFTTPLLPPVLAVQSSHGSETVFPDTVLFGTARDPSGITSLTVNGQAVPWRATDGYFELQVPLALGPNAFSVVATDGLGQVQTANLIVSRLPLPDLVVTSVTGPTVAGLGMPFTITATICNVGPGDTDPAVEYFYIGWFLWEADVPSPEAVLLHWNTKKWSGFSAGGCGTFSQTVKGSSQALLGRRWFLGAVADITDQFWEENEDNNDNISETSFTLQPPDLVPVSVTAPSTIGTATPFDLTTVVENRGLGQAVSAVADVYLSTDDTITSADRKIASHALGVQPGGQTVTKTSIVTLPCDIPAGPYRLGVIVDGGATIVESNDANNVLLGPAVTVAGPDLVVTSVTGPGSVLTGASATIQDTVTAASGGGASAFTVRFYLSTDTTITSADLLLGERSVPGLASGESSTGTTVVTIPTTWAGGWYHLGAIADVHARVLETDETNNVGIGGTLEIVGPDLVATDVTAPASAFTGETITIQDTVMASAAGGATPEFDVAFYLSTDATITTADMLIGWRHSGPLAPGASSSASTALTLPTGLAPGTYHLGIVADDFSHCWEDEWETQWCAGGDAAKEPDGSNNARASGPVTILGVDLVMTGVSAPATGATGTSLVVHDTVTANGGGTAGFYVAYYLSADATITTSDVYLGRRLVVLAPGASSTADTAVTVPATLVPGTYRVGAIADYQGMIAEGSETNNALAGNEVVIAGADLYVSAVSATDPVELGTPVSVSTTVANHGPGASGNFAVGLYLSTDATITSSDIYLTSWTASGLAPGASSTTVRTVTVPANVSGTLYLGAIADRYNHVKEGNEANNTLAGQTVTVRSPDLTPTSVSGPAAARTGDAIVVSDTVSALAAGGSAPASTVTLYLSPDPIVTSDDVYVGTRSVPAIPSGGSSSGTTLVTVPAGLSGGTYYVGARADAYGAVLESDETNNALAGSAIVITGPDLFATALSGPPDAVRGGAITVVNTVTAAGAGGAAPGFYVGVYLSTDGVITSSDRLLGYRHVGGLQPGASSSDATLVTLPADAAPGTYTLGLLVDNFSVCWWEYDGSIDADVLVCATDLAKESDEANNALAGGTIVVQ